MKKIKLLFLSFILSGLVLAGLTSCGGEGTNEDETDTTNVEAVDSTVVEEKGLAAGMTPFDFPKVDMQASEGDYVLIPGYKMWQNSLAKEDPTNETYIFYTGKMSKAGEIESEIEFTFDGKQMMPNSIMIPIPAEQTAEKGDIVLTWWQTGSGMQRAIVTDASNPSEPIVRYLDLGYDNPAKDGKSGKSIGQTDYPLKPNSFVKLTGEWQAGNMLAAKDGDKMNSVQIIRVAEGKVLTLGFAGKIKVYNKSDCTPVPIVPDVKKGDKIQAVFVGGFGEYEVSKVDKKIGRVFVKQFDKDVAVSYGQVYK